MTSQRFCLRWNNHQSNLLSVFDQLLHAETFTDVTLAVEGQYLKAHKMVLSACSPYFNALFVNHPEKHPIVILKDVPYADMKSLLDFMYRGEVSVDQERLTAFLRVAESLRIKGLTEVNDEKPLGPAITPPPPQLHRIQPYLVQQRKAQGMLMNSSPLLGSALSMPKRKRGRPRKLSGSSNGTGNDFDDYDRENLVQGSPEILEVKMGTEGYSGNEGSDDNTHRESRDNEQEHDSNQEAMDTSETTNNNKTTQSKEAPAAKDNDNNSVSDHMNTSPELTQRLLGYKPDMDSKTSLHQKLKLNPPTQSSLSSSNSLLQQQLQNDSLNNNNPTSNSSVVLTQQSGDLTTTSSVNNLQHPFLMHMNPVASSSSPSDFYKHSPTQNTGLCGNESIEGVEAEAGGGSGGNTLIDPMSPSLSGMSKPPQRRRIRRKATSSPDDQAEHLTEMSVRGLDLFRYASITEGVYQCTECAKENVQKTFKNKYSFQRHAFLYHEGKHRKVFPCPVCGKEFSRPDKMKNHMKTTHECYIPKEVNYHPLNYLITAAAAGEIQQIFPQIEGTNNTAAQPTTVSPVKVDKHPIKSENVYIKSEPPPTPATESSISLKETEEVK